LSQAWERIRIAWAASVGTAVGLLLSALLFGPRGSLILYPAADRAFGAAAKISA